VKIKHYLFVGLLVVGLLYVYHMMIAQKGSASSLLSGLGINR
jgi:hypothetical protein